MAERGKAKVRLYYLGGLGQKAPRPDGKVFLDTVTASGTRFNLPKPGEYLEVEERFAKELEAKHRYSVDGGKYEYSAFTRDKRIADRVKAGESAFQAYQARTVLAIDSVSDDALFAELQKRGKLSAAGEPVEVPEEEEAVKVVTSKAVAKKAAAKPAARTVNKNAPKKAVDMIGELTSKADADDGMFEDGIDLSK